MSAPEQTEDISYSVSDRVALIRFERPDRMNGWSAEMQEEYKGKMARAERDPDVRVVVVTGAGKTFSVGADTGSLDEMSGSGVLNVAPPDPLAVEVFGSSGGYFGFAQHMTKPVIAALNGAAAGVGFVLSCFCDIRFAAEGAKLTVAMTRLGLPAEHGLSWILPKLVGVTHAADLLLASPVVVAEEAARIGLVNRVYPRDEVLDRAMEYARTLATTISPSSMRMMKAQLYGDLGRDVEGSIAQSRLFLDEALASADYREGVAAFLEKRPPAFPPGRV